MIKAQLNQPTEPAPEKDESGPRITRPDLNLSQFRFKKKPHIKIEYDDHTPTEKEGKGIWEPPNWRDFLLNLQIMRSNNDAPVDSMGCHMSMDENAPPQVYRYQSLVSLMLSSQTKDQVTFAAMERLRARGLTIDNIIQMSDEELGQLIYPVGFWKTKVKYIKKTTQTLKEQYNGDIPDSVEKLCKLTGVGPKMAHICMKVAWNKITGIGVDTHVHRISNRIGWVRTPTSTPEDTRKALQTWIPFELWSEVNHLMVGFGQTICLPINPTCDECLNSDICPSSNKNKKSPKNPKKDKQTIKVGIKVNEKSLSPVKQTKFDTEAYEKFATKELKPVISEDSINENHILELVQKSKSITPSKRKVTPKKELKLEEPKSHKTKKITPKELKLEEPKTQKSKKITTKEESLNKTIIENEVGNQKEKCKQINVQQRVTRNKTQNNLDVRESSIGKKSPLKRKSPKNKSSEGVVTSSTEDVKKKTKTNKSQ